MVKVLVQEKAESGTTNRMERRMYDDMGRLTLRGLASKYREVLGLNFANAPISIDTIIEFIRNLDNNAVTPKNYFYDMFVELRDEARDNTQLSEVAKGGYGAVYRYKDADEADKIIKEQFELVSREDGPTKREQKYRDFFIEVLIQTILCNDKVNGIHVPTIYSVWRSGYDRAYTLMKKMNGMSSEKVFELYQRSNQKVSFEDFQTVIYTYANIMKDLYDRYEFVHMDFKLGNTGFTVPTDGPDAGKQVAQIFDFGSGCIKFSGLNIRARAFYLSDIKTSACNRAADFILFLSYIYLYYRDSLDKTSLKFVSDIIKAPIPHGKSAWNTIKNSRTGHRIRDYYLAMYNYKDNKFINMPNFYPENILITLKDYVDEFEAEKAASAAAQRSRNITRRRSRSRSRSRNKNRRTARHESRHTIKHKSMSR